MSKYVTDGGYKYELFSVLVHSGNANGGHYYACIKRFDDGKWYNFNDQNVAEITEDDVKIMYGGEDGEASKSRYKAIGASTNAYMLVYRRIQDGNKTSVSADLISDDLRQEIIKENEELKRQLELYELAQQQITIKCHCNVASPLILQVNKKQNVKDISVSDDCYLLTCLALFIEPISKGKQTLEHCHAK